MREGTASFSSEIQPSVSAEGSVLQTLFGKFCRNRPTRFLVVGGWNTLFGYSSFALLYFLFSTIVHYFLIIAVSTIINVTNAFLCYKFVVFQTRGNYVREYLRFYVVYAVPIGMGFVLFPLLIEGLRMNPYLAQAVITVLTIAISYFGHKRISFKA